jgi:hypothetical protein
VENSTSNARRGRRLLTVLAAAGVLAAVPAGVALAGGTGSSGDDAPSRGSAIQVQSTQPDGRDGDRDCPEHRGQDRQEAEQQL